jgi:Uncharacterised nucleotidyltransferase
MKPAAGHWSRLAMELLALGSNGIQPRHESRQRLLSSFRTNILDLERAKLDSLYYITCEPEAPAQTLYQKVWDIQRQAAEEATCALAGGGVSPLLFKGADFLIRYFNCNALSLLADIDILVERSHIGKTKQILYCLGYRQSYLDRALGGLTDFDVADTAEIESQHYELAAFCRLVPLPLNDEEFDIAKKSPRYPIFVQESQCSVVVQLDIHHRVALDIESAQFFERSRPGATKVGLGMSPSDNLWFTTARFYNEVALHGKTTLRDFAYLLGLLRRETIDWDVVVSASVANELNPALYYYLKFLSNLSINPVPESILVRLSPDRGLRNRDWGSQLEKQFGLLADIPKHLTTLPHDILEDLGIGTSGE